MQSCKFGRLCCLALAGLAVQLAAAAPAVDPARAQPFDGRDATASPGADFFAYANGGWIRATPIPADRSSYGIAAQLQELADRRTADLIRAVAGSGAADGSDARRVGDYFAAYMDVEAIERAGLAPLQPLLDEIGAIHDRKALAATLGRSLRADVDVLNNTATYTPRLFGLWVAQDLDRPTRYLPFLLQGGLGMPDRDYYLKETASMANFRARYREHIAALLVLAGDTTAAAADQAERIARLEARIAAVHASRTDTEDVRKGDNHWPRARFGALADGLDWETFFSAAGLADQQEFVVWQPGAVQGIARLVTTEPLETWKEYLRYHVIDDYAPVLPHPFAAEHFHFHDQILAGTPRQPERWRLAVDATSAALGEAVGRLYVERYFPPGEKARAEAMVRDIVAAFGRRIDQLEWMAPATRRMAKAKLASLRVGVGYPDHWRDYSGLRVAAGEALANRQRAERFEYQSNIAKLGRPVDRDEWVMNPQLVDAVNLPVMNAIEFPAAILQPPLFSPAATAAMNYGATGATIGHEISHSFDDQGALFDADGRLHDWWTPADYAHFTASGAALARQFNGYRPFADIAVDGRQTLSENIADLAGLAAAYDAYRLSLAGGAAPVVDGLSGDQQFFLSYAQSWREKIREPALRQQLVTDGHAPAEYRADTVRNIDAWYAAFAVPAGAPLYLAPGARVRVW